MAPELEPRLESEACLLRAPVLADAAHLSRYAGEMDVARMTASIPSPYPVLAAELWVLSVRAGWGKRPNFAFTIEKDGDCAGGAGVFKRKAQGDWEIGYWIGRPWQGRGLATEAAGAVKRFATETLGADRLIASHAEDNPASGRVLEKLGFRYTGEAGSHWAMARLGQARCLGMEWRAAG